MSPRKHSSKLLLFMVISSLFVLFLQQRLVEATPVPPQLEESQVVTISDPYYGYSFTVPSAWYREMGVTPDRWTIYDSPDIRANKIMLSSIANPYSTKIDFTVETVANLLPDPEVRNPIIDERGNATSKELLQYLPEGTWIQVDDLPALIVEDALTIMHGRAQGLTDIKATTVYILADHLVYCFYVTTLSTPSGRQSLSAAHSSVLETFLPTFSVDIMAPASSNFPEQ